MEHELYFSMKYVPAASIKISTGHNDPVSIITKEKAGTGKDVALVDFVVVVHCSSVCKLSIELAVVLGRVMELKEC
jgi:hypothetical protein